MRLALIFLLFPTYGVLFCVIWSFLIASILVLLNEAMLSDGSNVWLVASPVETGWQRAVTTDLVTCLHRRSREAIMSLGNDFVLAWPRPTLNAFSLPDALLRVIRYSSIPWARYYTGADSGIVLLCRSDCERPCITAPLNVSTARLAYRTTQCQNPIFCTPLSSKTPTRLQPVGSLKVGRYISEFQHSLQGIYTVSQKKLGHFFTAYNFGNIEQIFTKLGVNHDLFLLNIMP